MISYEEFVVFISDMKEPTPEDQLRCILNLLLVSFLSVAFCLYDENNDGLISIQDLNKQLSQRNETSAIYGLNESSLAECISEVLLSFGTN